MGHGGSARNNGTGRPAAVRDLLAAITAAAEDNRFSPGLRAGLRRLGQDLHEGEVPVDTARDEVRTLLGGLALRNGGHGAQCCEVTEALTRELVATAGTQWDGVAVPGAVDRSGARTGLIELPFPANDFWGIAAAVHEVGHILANAPRLGGLDHNPARRLIDAEQPPAAQHEELFCDFYATYALGPAFPAFMVTGGLDPAEENSSSDPAAGTHPSAHERVLVMLCVLARVDSRAHDVLETAWRAQGHPAPTGDSAERLTHFADRLWHQVAPTIGTPFRTSMAARFLRDDLAGNTPLPSADGLRVLDVIGAAWDARIDVLADLKKADRIAGRALALLDRIVPRREGAGDARP